VIGGSSSAWHGRDCVQELCNAIEECKCSWGSDPAYKDVLYRLERIEQDLDSITASPGHRAALRAQGPKQSGQVPGEERGEHMAAQHG
jgi:hypothetical protein